MNELLKKVAKEVINELPKDASDIEFVDAIVVRLSTMKGFNDIDNGRYLTQEQLLQEIRQWL